MDLISVALCELVDSGSSEERMLSCLRQLRNGCAEERNSLYLLGEHARLLPFLKKYFRHLAMDKDGSSSNPPIRLNVSCQLLSNLSHMAYKEADAFDYLAQDLFLDAIAAVAQWRDRDGLAALIGAIYNCVFGLGSRGNAKNTADLWARLAKGTFWKQLMLAYPHSDNASQRPKEWMTILITKLLENGHLCALLQILSDGEGTGSTRRTNHEQVILLHIVDDVLTMMTDKHAKFDNHDFLRLLCIMRTQLVELLDAFKLVGVSGESEEIGIKRNHFFWPNLLAHLNLVGSMISHTSQTNIVSEQTGERIGERIEDEKAGEEKNGDSELMKLLLQALQTGIVTAAKKPELAQLAQITLSILNLISNLLYHNPSAQSTFLASEGFAKVLPLCATNMKAPLMREWALLCIRNACENNRENQDYVATIAPMGPINMGGGITTLDPRSQQNELGKGNAESISTQGNP